MKRVVVPLLSLAVVAVLPTTAFSATAAGGYYHTVVRTSTGNVYAWGANGSGQLGIGSYTTQTLPTQVTSLTGVTAVATGANHTLALKSNGTVWAFGANNYGQLGDGTTTGRNAPVQVTGLTGVTIVAIAAGDNHSLALKNDGSIYTWGYGGNGQLGDGGTGNRTSPYVVVNHLATAIAAGGNHTLIVKADGSMKSWGANASGQLGDGTTTQATNPVSVSVVSSMASASGGTAFSLARQSNSTAWAWGLNGNNQLGDGTTIQRPTAVPITGLGTTAASPPAGFTAWRSRQTGPSRAGGTTSTALWATARRRAAALRSLSAR